jgi:hypothetical protein
MQSEVVNMTVLPELLKVECSFVFVNHGPACSVRMGFPDQSSGDSTAPGEPLKGAFLSYESYLDGIRVSTETVKGDDESYENMVWHANEVNFAAESTRVVRDVYTMTPGFLFVSDKGAFTNIFSYLCFFIFMHHI